MTDEEVTEQVPNEESEHADAEYESDADAEAQADADAEGEAAATLSEESEALVADAAAADDELAADLEDRLRELEAQKEEAEASAEDFETRLKRKQADFQNYKKRAKKRQEQMEARAAEDLVERLLDVRDNLKRAVEDDHEDVASLKEGVEMTLKELDRVFADEDVAEIDPDPGTATDPQRHEVMMQVESEQPAGTVADVYQPGYEMGEKVLRPAQVTVSDSDEE